MAQTQEVRGVHTSIQTKNGVTEVVYRGTTVIKFNEVSVIFETKGHRTNTTKTRMTQANNQFDLKMNVYQKGGKLNWFISSPWFAEAVEFMEGRVYPRWDRIVATWNKVGYHNLMERALTPTEDGEGARKVLLDLFEEQPHLLPTPFLKSEE